jgi:hypothetical protein
LELWFLLVGGPWSDFRAGEGTAALFLARRVTGGGGPAREKEEETKGYLLRVLGWREMAG